MVQIIPRTQPTFGERIGAGVEQGVNAGSKYAKMAIENKMTQKAEKERIASKLKLLEQPEYQEFFKGIDPKLAKLATLAAAGVIEPGVATSMAELIRQGQSDIDFNKALAGGEPEGIPGVQDTNRGERLLPSSEGTQPSLQEAPTKQPSKNFEGKISKLQDALRFATTPQKRAQVESKIKELQRQQTLEFKKGQAGEKKATGLRAETLPIRKEIAEKANAAMQGIQNKKQLLDLVRSGNIDDPTYAIIAQALPLRLGERMLSPESVQYRGAIIDEFKDLRTVFQGQTRIKEIDLLEDKIAGLYLTDEQKEALLTSRINALQADVIKGEVAAELESEGDFGGALQFQKKVNERAQARLKDLFNVVLDEQKSIIQNAENKKKIPLNSNDPDDIEIIDQILEEAGGNWREAEKLAKKRGYKFNA